MKYKISVLLMVVLLFGGLVAVPFAAEPVNPCLAIPDIMAGPSSALDKYPTESCVTLATTTPSDETGPAVINSESRTGK